MTEREIILEKLQKVALLLEGEDVQKRHLTKMVSFLEGIEKDDAFCTILEFLSKFCDNEEETVNAFDLALNWIEDWEDKFKDSSKFEKLVTRIRNVLIDIDIIPWWGPVIVTVRDCEYESYGIVDFDVESI